MTVTVDRAIAGTTRSFTVRRAADNRIIRGLTHRDVQALAAARHGHVRAVLRRTYAPWFYDARLEPECDVYGVGYGTLTGLQGSPGSEWWPALITTPDDAGPVALTDLGDQVLDAILALPDVHIPITAAAA